MSKISGSRALEVRELVLAHWWVGLVAGSRVSQSLFQPAGGWAGSCHADCKAAVALGLVLAH